LDIEKLGFNISLIETLAHLHNLFTIILLATFAQLPWSMIKEQACLLIKHIVWKIFSLWVSSSSLAKLPNNRLRTNKSPSKAYSTFSISLPLEEDDKEEGKEEEEPKL